MAISTLSEAESIMGEVRNITSAILLSLLAAELVLFFSLGAILDYIHVSILLSFLLVSLSCGYMLTKTGMMQRLHVLVRLFYGFLIAGGGLLLFLIALQNLHYEYLLLPGAVFAGLGQGMAGETVNYQWQGQRPSDSLLAGLALTMLLSGLLVLIVHQSGELTGAAALLLDISLLGALYIKIIQQTS